MKCFSCPETADVRVIYAQYQADYCEGCADDVVPRIEDDGYEVDVVTLAEVAEVKAREAVEAAKDAQADEREFVETERRILDYERALARCPNCGEPKTVCPDEFCSIEEVCGARSDDLEDAERALAGTQCDKERAEIEARIGRIKAGGK